MARYNTGAVRAVRTKVSSPVTATGVETKTFEGGKGFLRTPKAELFLLGASSFNEDAFYESANDRNVRVRQLVSQIVNEPDGVEWLGKFVEWLRNVGNIRTQSMIIALETAKIMIDKGIAGSRKIVASALTRADEPAEAIAYWHSTFGRNIPQAVKRGIADAAVKTYNERSVFKYDSKAKSIRFADVIQLVHPSPKDARQSAVFKFALDRRYNDNVEVPSELKIVSARQELKSLNGDDLRKLANDDKLAEYISKSGMTWEALSGQISGGMDAKAWEAVIPSMGYMALLRNLRNFLDANVSDKVMRNVLDKIQDPQEVAKSKQLPFRFLSAYKELSHNLKVAAALEAALGHSLVNVPKLSGRTLILVDNSSSMSWGVSEKSKMSYAEIAGLFGSAMALSGNDVDLYAFGTEVRPIAFRKGESVLKVAAKFNSNMGGTYTQDAINKTFRGHDRVIIIGDEQHAPTKRYYGYYSERPVGNDFGVGVPLYTWNLAGYQPAGASGDNVFAFGGMSDASFNLIKTVETAYEGKWPWS